MPEVLTDEEFERRYGGGTSVAETEVLTDEEFEARYGSREPDPEPPVAAVEPPVPSPPPTAGPAPEDLHVPYHAPEPEEAGWGADIAKTAAGVGNRLIETAGNLGAMVARRVLAPMAYNPYVPAYTPQQTALQHDIEQAAREHMTTPAPRSTVEQQLRDLATLARLKSEAALQNRTPEAAAPVLENPNPRNVAMKALEMGGDFAPAMAAGPFGPLVFGAQAAGGGYGQLLDEGASPAEAERKAALVGIENAALAKIALPKLLAPMPEGAKKQAMGVILGGAGSGLMGGGGAAATEATLHPAATAETIARMVSPYEGLTEADYAKLMGILDATVGGAAFGGGLHGLQALPGAVEGTARGVRNAVRAADTAVRPVGPAPEVPAPAEAALRSMAPEQPGSSPGVPMERAEAARAAYAQRRMAAKAAQAERAERRANVFRGLDEPPAPRHPMDTVLDVLRQRGETPAGENGAPSRAQVADAMHLTGKNVRQKAGELLRQWKAQQAPDVQPAGVPPADVPASGSNSEPGARPQFPSSRRQERLDAYRARRAARTTSPAAAEASPSAVAQVDAAEGAARIMGRNVRFEAADRVDGVDYEIYREATPDGDAGIVRIYDNNGGETVGIKRFPNFEGAFSYYRDSLARARGAGTETSPEPASAADRRVPDPVFPRPMEPADALREMARDKTKAKGTTEVGALPVEHAEILDRLGVPVPAGTPHVVFGHKITHALKSHPDLTPDDIARIPEVIQSPNWIGATKNSEGLRRVWFVKQNGEDSLYIAVYGKKKNQLTMHGFFKGDRDVLFGQLKQKGVPLAAVANSAVSPDEAIRRANPGLSHPVQRPSLEDNSTTLPAPPQGARTARENVGDDALTQFRSMVRQGGIKPLGKMTQEDFGGKFPVGLIRKKARLTWDQWGEQAVDMGLLPKDYTPDRFLGLLRGNVPAARDLTAEYERGALDRRTVPVEVNEAEMDPGDLVKRNGEWYRVEPGDDGGKILKDGEVVKVDDFDSVPVEHHVTPDEPSIYEEAQRRFQAQENVRARQSAPQAAAGKDLFGNDLPPEPEPVRPTDETGDLLGDMAGAERQGPQKPDLPGQVPLIPRADVRPRTPSGEAEAARNAENYPAGGEPLKQSPAPAKSEAGTEAVVEQPELVRIAREIVGHVPKIRERLGNALGRFSHQGSRKAIHLRADIFIGPEVRSAQTRVKPDAEAVETFRRQARDAHSLSDEETEVRVSFDARRRRYVLRAYKKDPTYANRTLAHEIGHAVDYLPDETMARGNILGRIATLKRYMKNFLERTPASTEELITPEDRTRLRRQARAEVPAGTPERAEALRARYRELLRTETERRGLWSRDEITDELKGLTGWWKPFDPDADAEYTAYRHSSKELYADALSVMLNHPEALKQRAPKFWAAFGNYLERKPQVRDLYDGIQAEIRSGENRDTRLDDVYGMFRRGERERTRLALEEAGTQKNGLGAMVREALRVAVDDRSVLPKDTESYAPRAAVSDMRYAGAYAKQLVREVEARIDAPMMEAGATPEDLGVFLELRRAATERSTLANPLGIGGNVAEQTLRDLRVRLGADRYAAVERAAGEWWDIRKEYVMPKLRESGLFDGEMLDRLENNEYYATFNVVDYMAEKHGGGPGAKLYRQFGTLSDVENVFTATLRKDLSMVSAAVRNRAKVEAARAFEAEGIGEPAEKRWRGDRFEYREPGDPDRGLLLYTENGELQGRVVPREVVELYESDPTGAKILTDFFRRTSMPLKGLMTTYSPLFLIRNPLRDIRGMYKNLPGTFNDKVTKLAPAIVRAHRDAFIDAFLDRSTDLTKQAYKDSVLLTERGWRGHEQDNATTELERIFADRLGRYRDNPEAVAGLWRRFGRLAKAPFDALERANLMAERMGKLASYRYMKDTGLYDQNPPRAKEIVRTRGGSPDFRAGGTKRVLLNNVFLFSNAKIQGMRAGLEAAREHPGQYAAWTAATSILPRLVLYGAGAGLFGSFARRVVEGIPDHDKQFYNVIPLGLTADGKSVYIPLPEDHEGQFFGTLAWTALKQSEGARPGEIAQALDAENPAGALNPTLRLAVDAMQYLTGRNPYDPYYGELAMDDVTFQAGGADAAKAMAGYEWNQQFGYLTGIRFTGKTDAEVRNEFEKLLDTPGLGPFLKTFVRVSDRGVEDRMRREMGIDASKDAARQLEVRRIIRDSVEALPEDAGRPAVARAAANAYREARKRGLLAPGYRYGMFKERYEANAVARFGDAYDRARRYASKGEKAIIDRYEAEAVGR